MKNKIIKLNEHCCIDCGKEIKNYYTKRCQSCAKKELYKNPENNPNFGKRGKNASGYKDGSTIRIYYCKEKRCNNIITYQTWKYGKGYCALCANKGKRCYNWNNGSSFDPYPLGWTKTFKEQIRYRDNYKCQLCGCSELENGRRLDVHHIDYDKDNLLPENLVSLCRHCHPKTNHNRNYWFAYFMYIANQEIK